MRLYLKIRLNLQFVEKYSIIKKHPKNEGGHKSYGKDAKTRAEGNNRTSQTS